MYVTDPQRTASRSSTYTLPLPTDRPPTRLDDLDADVDETLRTMQRSLNVIQARIAALGRQCDHAQRNTERSSARRQRDVLHLRARIQSLLQTARDVNVVLQRLHDAP